MLNSFIWLIERILSRVTILGQSRPGIIENERVLRIPQIFMGGASASDCLIHIWDTHRYVWESYPFANMQLVHSTAQADWAKELCICERFLLRKEGRMNEKRKK